MLKGAACSLKKLGEKSILHALIILKFDFLKYGLNDTLNHKGTDAITSPWGVWMVMVGTQRDSPKQHLAAALLPPHSVFYTTYHEMNRVMKTGPGSAPDLGAVSSGTRAV